MSNTYEIEFSIKDNTQNPQRRVTHVGGRLADGTPWKVSAQEAMAAVHSGRTRYFVRPDGGERSYLVVSSHPLYGQFLTTQDERREPRTLLELPEVAPAPEEARAQEDWHTY